MKERPEDEEMVWVSLIAGWTKPFDQENSL